MRRLAVALLLAGCGGASSDPGLGASLQLAAANPDEHVQFVPGAMPGDGAGPAVVAMNVSAFTVEPGAIDQPLLGTLAASATAIAIGLDGDRGYWLLTAGVPDTDSPTLPSFAARMAFARTLPPGPVSVVARAVDGRGAFGPASRLALQVAGAPPATGLAVTLRWDSATDLDLHVVDPSGAEIWADAPTSPSGGSLDLDSNAGCVIDGRDAETVRWAAPPSGHYDVRVDAFSLCGLPAAAWRVDVTLDGAALGSASGEMVEADTFGPHQRGAGREALGFDVP